MNARELPTPVLQGGHKAALALGAVGIAAFGLQVWGFAHAPERAFSAYLAAYAYALSIALGCLAFVMISHAARATWPVAVRRLPEAVAISLPLLAALFIPIALGISHLYPWATPDAFEPHLRALLEHRRAFMTPRAFAARAGFYLALWSVLAVLLRGVSLAVERGADPVHGAERARRLSYAGLPLTALTAALAAFEWLMSLSVEYASTMFGALWLSVCLFTGQAATVALTGLAQFSRAPLPAAGSSHYSALGRLLFAWLMFLGYTMFFQFLLGWMGNRPSEAEWFLERWEGPYRSEVMFLIFGVFALPFFLLLSSRLKRHIGVLAPLALWCLASAYAVVHWLVVPAARGPAFSFYDVTALLAVLGTSASFCLFMQRGKALAPSLDERYAATFSYQSR